MDDLMRMASGQYQESESTEQRLLNDSSSQNLDEAVFQQAQTSVSSQQSRSSPSLLKFPQCRWYFILLSIFTPLAFIGLNVGLGYYGIFVYKPELLVIDKSVKSFSIPNHEAYIHYESFMLAKKNVTVRFRRSVDVSLPINKLWSNFSKRIESDKRLLPSVFSKKLDDSEFPNFFSLPEASAFSLNNLYKRLKRSYSEIRCQYQSKTRWKMHVIYLAHGDNDTNMFTKERLQTAHQIEKSIMEHPEFTNYCLRDPYLAQFIPAMQNMQGCVPPNSLLTYFFPSMDDQGRIYYDEMGATIGDIDSALKLAMNHESFYYFVDDKINKTYPKSQMLRTEILFGAPLHGFCSADKTKKEEDDKFRNFVVTYINNLSHASTDKVHVLYGGNEIFDYEVTTTFWNDVRLAVFSLVAIFVLMLVLSLSPFLTVVGMIIIGLSFPISLFFYRVVFGINALGILNGAAAFVIIGIGVDDVFVFINIYRQASQLQGPVQRIKYTVRVAGVATFFTSFTTAAAFAANLASSIPAVHDFGLFMALIVSACWISVFVLMPPTLYLYACFFEPLEICIYSCLYCCEKKVAAPEHHLEGYTQSLVSEDRVYEDDDVQMLVIDGNDPGLVQGQCDDEMLLMDDPYATVGGRLLLVSDSDSVSGEHQEVNRPGNSEPESSENVCIGKLIHKLLVFLTDRIIIPVRYAVIGLSAVLLIASCVLMSHLQPSTHPPQLFRQDTNIQQLLDLKANFSFIDAIQCDRCSGLYNLNQSAGSSRTTSLNIIYKTTVPPPPYVGPDVSQPHQQAPPTDSPTTLQVKSTTSQPWGWTTHLRTAAPITPQPLPRTTIRNDVHTSSTQHDNTDVGTQKIGSVNATFNPCSQQSCNNLKDRPLLESGATVYVVFGVTGVDRSREDVGHVLDQYKSTAKFDPAFSKAFDFNNANIKEYINEMCKVCKLLANVTDLVKPGSAQCIPNVLKPNGQLLLNINRDIPECLDLPDSSISLQSHAVAHAEGGINIVRNQLIWLAFAFESTTSEGQAYFEAYKQYLKWEELMSHIKNNVLSAKSPLKSMFQTSKFWTKVLMEVVAVNSAIYGLVLSMIICIISVAIFTGHLLLLLIIVIAILVMICCVVGIFYLAGWEMGAVEAVSLSILVGSSVDYCVHLVEGYILAGKKMSLAMDKSASSIRRERTSYAVRHIGVAIVCSALTTIIAAVPLTQTFIQPFTKFGSILLINTTVSLVITLTLTVALLATIAPARYKGTWKSYVKATVLVIVLTGAFFLALYIATVAGVTIPGPSGQPLFS
ncbi:patched domain-containing protein 2 [Biomphalaria pfeifferi]|uniref:Patched domain-containing protein 2 n=1 Tax=Biomphalaria pfeifferi TaxID=112525 RepID=A0AAD8FFD0_BIOPF|nr:patched domain-containing protein 2 [Biomphalaria pfeifferi]